MFILVLIGIQVLLVIAILTSDNEVVKAIYQIGVVIITCAVGIITSMERKNNGQ